MKDVIETKTETIQLGIYDGEKEENILIDDDTIEEVAKKYELDEKTLQVVVNLVEEIKEKIVADLKDIWSRVNSTDC